MTRLSVMALALLMAFAQLVFPAEASAALSSIEVCFQCFDRLITSFFHLYGTALVDFASVTLENRDPSCVTLRVETWIEGLSLPESEAVDLASGETLTLSRKPVITPEAYDTLDSGRLADFRVRVMRTTAGEDAVIWDERSPVDIYSHHDFVWVDSIGIEDNLQRLAAFVTPDASAVRRLLSWAADYRGDKELDYGYDGVARDENWSVWLRLDALWRAEREVGLSLAADVFRQGLPRQKLRAPAEVLNDREGGALELALLYASATEALGLKTALLFTPDKTCVVVCQDEGNTQSYCIDTALVGSSEFIKAEEAGRAIWQEAFSRLQDGEEGYAWVDLEQAWADGIMPLPYSPVWDGADDTVDSLLARPVEASFVYTEDLITAFYHLYGTVLDDFAHIYLKNQTQTPVTLMVESWIEGYSMTAVNTVVVAPGERLECRQNPRLQAEVVEDLNSQRPGNFRVRVTHLKEGEDDIILNEGVEITLYSRKDFVWVPGCNPQEQYELYAAFITPTDSKVEELLRRAADYTSSGILISGYQGGEYDADGDVYDRLNAIWKAEEEYSLIYVSTMVAFSPGFSQRVRTPRDVLTQGSGNCIETTLLYASAVEAIGLEAALIRVPGHAYIAVRQDDVNAMYWVIETTLIGRSNFSGAINAGYSNWQRDFPRMEAGEPGYLWVNLSDARARGILPIPWK